MRETFGFHLLSFALIAATIVFGVLYLYNPTVPPLILYFYLALALLVIRLWLAAINRISRSSIPAGVKFCWVVLAIFLPVIGSIATLMVVKE